MNKRIISKTLLICFVLNLGLSCLPKPKVSADEGVTTVTGSVGVTGSVKITSFDDSLMESGGLKVWVLNKPKGTLNIDQYYYTNNLGKMDNPAQDITTEPRGGTADIKEVHGVAKSTNAYTDSGSPTLNYLIENGVIQRSMIATLYPNATTGDCTFYTYTRSDIGTPYYSDLLMGLIKCYEGPSLIHNVTLDVNMNKDTNYSDYEYKQNIAQDSILGAISLHYGYKHYLYEYPNDKKLYMERATKLGLIQSTDIASDISDGLTVGTLSITTSDKKALTIDSVDYYQALKAVEAMVKLKEGFVSDEDIAVTNYLYGFNIDKSVSDDMKSTIRFLVAKGIIFPTENIFDGDFTKDDMIRLLYRVKNKDQRFSIKTVKLSDTDTKAVLQGLVKSKVELYKGLKSVDDVLPSGTATDLGASKNATGLHLFIIEDFFNQKTLDYMSNTLSLPDNAGNRQQFADRYYFTFRSLAGPDTYMTNYMGTRDHYSISVTNNDLNIILDDDSYNQLVLLSKTDSQLNLNSADGADYPTYIDFPSFYAGEYSWDDSTFQSTFVSDVTAPTQLTDSSSTTGQRDYIINQDMFFSTGVDLSALNWINSDKTKSTLPDAVKSGSATVMVPKSLDDTSAWTTSSSVYTWSEGSKYYQESVPDTGVVKYTVAFKIKAPDALTASKIVQSRLSVNTTKYSGFASIDGLSDSGGQLIYVGRDFLTYFGDINIVADKVLFNKTTGTYCLLLEGTPTSSKDSNQTDLKSVICGASIKRFALGSPDLVYTVNSKLFYKLDAISDLLSSDSFTKMGGINKFFGTRSGNDTTSLVDVKIKDPTKEGYTSLQTDYMYNYTTADKTKLSFLNMSNANFASDYVILDMYNQLLSTKGTTVTMADTRSISQNLRLVVKWNWYVPQRIWANTNPTTITGFGDLLFKAPGKLGTDSDNNFYKLCKNVTDNLLGTAIGVKNTYSSSGYLVPQFILLGSGSGSTNAESSETKAYLWKNVISPSIADLNILTTQATESDEDKFNDFMTLMNGKYNSSYVDYSTGTAETVSRGYSCYNSRPVLDTDSAKSGILYYGDYLTDAKGSVYQLIKDTSSFVKASHLATGNGIAYYKGSGSTSGEGTVLVSPYDGIEDFNNMSSSISRGNVFTYSLSNAYGWVYMGDPRSSTSYDFLKDPSGSDKIESLAGWDSNKGFQISDSSNQSTIATALQSTILGYASKDFLLRDYLGNNLPLTSSTTGNDLINKILTLLPSYSDKIDLSPSYAIVRKLDKDGLNFSGITPILFSTDAYRKLNTSGFPFLQSDSKTIEYWNYDKNDSKGDVSTNIVAPVVRLPFTEYKVLNYASAYASTSQDAKVASGIIVRYTGDEHFTSVPYKFPNFNIAMQWSEALLGASGNTTAFIGKTTVGSIKGNAVISFNGTDSYAIRGLDGLLSDNSNANLSSQLTSNYVRQNGIAMSLINFIKNSEDGSKIYLNTNFIVYELDAVDGVKHYQACENQDGLNAFSSAIPFNLSLTVAKGSNFSFDYTGYTGETMDDLSTLIKHFYENYAKEASKSKSKLIALIAIQVLFLYIFLIFFAYICTKHNVLKNTFAKLYRELHVDFLKIMTLGVCGITEEISFLRASVFIILTMFIQGIILINYLGLPVLK